MNELTRETKDEILWCRLFVDDILFVDDFILIDPTRGVNKRLAHWSPTVFN